MGQILNPFIALNMSSATKQRSLRLATRRLSSSFTVPEAGNNAAHAMNHAC